MVPLPLALFDLVFRAATFIALATIAVVAVRAVLFVDEGEVHVLTDDDGEVDRILHRGIHYVSPLRTSGRTVDTSQVTFELAGGRTETDDGVVVSADVSGEIQVVDPEALVEGTRQHPRDVQDRIDEAYVTQVGYLPWDELEEDPEVLADACRRELEPALEQWGVELRRFDVERIERVE